MVTLSELLRSEFALLSLIEFSPALRLLVFVALTVLSEFRSAMTMMRYQAEMSDVMGLFDGNR